MYIKHDIILQLSNSVKGVQDKSTWDILSQNE